MQSPELALSTPKPKAHLSERSHHWRPSRRQICFRESRSHPSRTTRNCQSGRALGRTRPPCCVGNAGEITQEVTSNSVKPAPPRLNAFRASPPPSVQAPHRGHRPLPRGCWIRMRTRRCPGHRTDGSRPWLQQRPAPTESHEDGTAEPAMSDPDQPRRRSAGVARSPPAAGLPCGKTPRGPTAVARGRRRR